MIHSTMHTIFGGLKLSACMASGMIAGPVLGYLADVTPGVGPDTHVPLGTAVGVGVSCLLAAMWLSRRLTQLQDGQRKLGEGQARLEEGFKTLPCHNWEPECPPNEPSRKPSNAKNHADH